MLGHLDLYAGKKQFYRVYGGPYMKKPILMVWA
jgi:hypothetical protein